MAIFDRVERQLSRTVDRAFARWFEFTPMCADPNGRSTRDTLRPMCTGEGILEENPTDIPIEVGRRDRTGNSLRAIANGHRLELSVDIHRHPEVVDARQGDKVRVADSRKCSFDNIRVFRISEVRRDGMSRVVWVLTG